MAGERRTPRTSLGPGCQPPDASGVDGGEGERTGEGGCGSDGEDGQEAGGGEGVPVGPGGEDQRDGHHAHRETAGHRSRQQASAIAVAEHGAERRRRTPRWRGRRCRRRRGRRARGGCGWLGCGVRRRDGAGDVAERRVGHRLLAAVRGLKEEGPPAHRACGARDVRAAAAGAGIVRCAARPGMSDWRHGLRPPHGPLPGHGTARVRTDRISAAPTQRESKWEHAAGGAQAWPGVVRARPGTCPRRGARPGRP